jgi:hypothetical protein
MLLSIPTVIAFLADRECGREYGVGLRGRFLLLRRLRRNARRIETLSNVVEHLELVGAILRLPASVPGDVVECGCYRGRVSVNLSLACAAVGRRLVSCDSFAGLPEPNEYDREHHAVHTGSASPYWQGRFAASRRRSRPTWSDTVI